MKFLTLFCVLFFSSLGFASTSLDTTQASVRSVMTNYTLLVKKGRLMEAVTSLTGLLNQNIHLKEREKLAVYNNLGILHKNLGQYDVALGYYDSAESIYLANNFTDNSLLVSIYGNKVNIYAMKGDFKKALEYTEKAIRVNQESKVDLKLKYQTTSSLYLSAGIVYSQMSEFPIALITLNKSISLKIQQNLAGKENVYLQFAKTYAKMGNYSLADNYFQLSIKQSNLNKSFDIQLAYKYIEYADFLLLYNKYSEAIISIEKALNIAQLNLGEKNLFTSNCYQLKGDYYRTKKDYNNALVYYQKSLISGSKNFNNQNIESNPSISDITFSLWQLRVLRAKAEALSNQADQQPDKNKRITDLLASLNTNNLAIEMTGNFRFQYQDEQTRLSFNEKQKNVYITATESSLKLYDLTGDKKYLNLAYQTTQQCKANELKYEIARNKSFTTNEIPAYLGEKENALQRDIAAYNTLIRNELSSPHPDTSKLSYWKDRQFDLSRDLEKMIEQIENEYPRFTDKIKRGNIIPIETIQARLKPDENLIEYLFSEKDEKGNRKLYEFVITPKDLVCHTESVDSTLTSKLSFLKIQLSTPYTGTNNIENYNQLNQQLFEAYQVLIQPIEKHFTGKTLIVIPDDEISYLPFDAFLTSWKSKKRINYAELTYLIRDYSISYGYSTNTLWNNKSESEYRPSVIGFAPDYTNTASVDGKTFKSLKSSNTEIESILSHFSGIILKAGDATVAKFRSNIHSGSILHLAMHAEMDSVQAGSSSLIFTPDLKNKGNYRLYNYEIGQMSIHSPMVVLSACNTGNGKLYSGEGLMSLARNFVLAGVPSVVETLWPVEDVAGSKIMGDFYNYLSHGKPKSEALRLAKLDYIQNTSPSFVNPRFWAAYTLIGDGSAVKKIWWKEIRIILPLILSTIILIGLIIYRLRFLRIS